VLAGEKHDGNPARNMVSSRKSVMHLDASALRVAGGSARRQ
jgi:hypothetical protein